MRLVLSLASGHLLESCSGFNVVGIVRVTGEMGKLFEKCRQHIENAKRNAGLDPTTSVSEVLRHALMVLDEKFEADKKRPPRRAM